MAKTQKALNTPLKVPTKLVQNKLAIGGLLAFVAIIAAFGIYKVGFSRASDQRQDAWRAAMTFTGCSTNAYGVPATLNIGSSGGCVAVVQRMLNFWKNAPGADIRYPSNTLVQDGQYGVTTQNVVKQFQTAAHVPADGVVGPATWAQLYGCWGRYVDLTMPGNNGSYFFICRAYGPEGKG